MEKREKKARIDSLAELRRLRTEGGSRIESLKKVVPLKKSLLSLANTTNVYRTIFPITMRGRH